MTTERSRAAAPFASLVEVSRLVADFEAGSLPRAHWNHRAHLTIAAWYLLREDEADATARVIAGVRRYNRTTGIPTAAARDGYHETLILFWIAVVRRFLEAVPHGSALARINALLDVYGSRRDLSREYYSRRLLRSSRARLEWVEPDLRPLPEVGNALDRSAAVPPALAEPPAPGTYGSDSEDGSSPDASARARP